MRKSLKSDVLAAARSLFMSQGYDGVGMREIARAVGREPVQIYRLKLSKSDILAELILALNDEQITRLPELHAMADQHPTLEAKVCGYLRALYAADIEFLPIRAVGAAHGWAWGPDYEKRVIAQLMQLIQPVRAWLAQAALDQVEARCYAVWSLYYVGFRRAVMQGASPDDCLGEIRPSVELLLRPAPSAAPAKPRLKRARAALDV